MTSIERFALAIQRIGVVTILDISFCCSVEL